MKLLAFSAVTSAAFIAMSGPASSQALFIEGDMVRGAVNGAQGGAVTNFNPDGAPICVLANQFKHLEKVVFRFRVRDQSGRPVDGRGLKSLVVELPSGEKLQGNFGPHPPRAATDYFWTAIWDIPASYPSGTLTYKAIATDLADNQTSWAPFNRVTSQLLVLPGDLTPKP